MDNPRIEEWLNSCGEDYNKAYVLHHENISEQEADTIIHYLIYMTRLTEMPQVKIAPISGLFGHTLQLTFEPGDGNRGNTFALC